jgi:hypothetical protein
MSTKKDEEILCLKSSVGLETSPGAWMFVGFGEDIGKKLFSFHKKTLVGIRIGSGFSNSLEPDAAKCMDPDSVNPDPKHLSPVWGCIP